MRKKHLPAIISVAVLVGAALLLLVRPPGGTMTAAVDPHAVPVPTRGPTDAELQEQLQTQTEETSFRFRVSGAPVYFPDDGDWGLNVSNSVENKQSMYLVVTLDSTGEELYRSIHLIPGGQILRDKLTAQLPPGSHQATATAHVVNTETGDDAGTVEAAITLTVNP